MSKENVDKLPRGHAYMRFRNDGFTVEMDFSDKNVPLVEEILRLVLKRSDEIRNNIPFSGCEVNLSHVAPGGKVHNDKR